MTVVKPFKGIRPHKDIVEELMLNQFDHVILEKEKNITEEEIRQRATEIGYDIDTNPQLEYFLKVGIGYRKLIADGRLIQDEKNSYYLFGINWENHWLYGIVGAVHYNDYWQDNVKKHEDTIEENEAELVRITEAIDFNFNPIMLAYPDHNNMDKIVERIAITKEAYSYFSTENVEHKLWIIDDENTLAAIEASFKDIPNTYIADGHHRIASGAIVAKKRNEKGKCPNETPHNFFIGIHFPASQLRIYEFNRLVKDLGPYTQEEFLENLSHKFCLTKLDKPFRPQKKFEFGLYIDKTWYRMDYLNTGNLVNNPVVQLDVSVLRSEVMTGILGITNFRTTSQVAFIEGARGIDKMIQLVDKGEYKLAFTLYPANIEEMFDIANQHATMPPKATCIEPKLKSGMISRLLS